MKRLHSRHWYRRESHMHMTAMALLYGGFGLSMLIQPVRWTRTPAYVNLFQILPQHIWGIIFVAVAAVLGAAVVLFPRGRKIAVAGLTLACILTAFWLVQFVVRWWTSDSTTPETWGSFLLDLYVISRASAALDVDYP